MCDFPIEHRNIREKRPELTVKLEKIDEDLFFLTKIFFNENK
jgi:hypothetical protein